MLQSIQTLDCSEKFKRLNFQPLTRTYRGQEFLFYEMTRDGFMFLVIGFTGTNPWWLAKDVCDVLGTRTDNIPVILDQDEYKKIDPYSLGVNVSAQYGMTIINEPGLYSLIIRSRKSVARAFKRWVAHEVLPAVVRSGL